MRFGYEWRIDVGVVTQFVGAEFRSEEHVNGTGKTVGACLVEFAKNMVNVAKDIIIEAQRLTGGKDEELIDEGKDLCNKA